MLQITFHKYFTNKNARSIREIKEMFVRTQENGDLRLDMNVDFMMFYYGVLAVKHKR